MIRIQSLICRLALAALVLHIACSTEEGRLLTGEEEGTGASTDDSEKNDDGTEGAGADETDSEVDDGCSEAAALIYLVDNDKTLYSFDPPSKKFDEIGKIDCPTMESPVSMAVNREARAFVLYDGGALYEVSTKDASCVGKKANLWQGARETRGMGFSSIGTSSQDELFCYRMSPSPSQLAKIDIETFDVTAMGPMAGRPELTGTGHGELWGFFAAASGGPEVSKVDKETGALSETVPIDGTPTPYSWAFAFWGGDFYIFIAGTTGSTNVYKLSDGQLSLHIGNTGKLIVGAGVSTCAPVMVFK